MAVSDHDRKYRHMADDRHVTQMEATEFLGYSPQMLEKLLSNGKLVPEIIVGRSEERLYSMKQLREYRAKYINPEGMGLAGIAVEYGITHSTAYYHFCVKRKIEPVGWKSNEAIYSYEDIRMIAKAEMWVKGVVHKEAPQLIQPLRLR